ncbi:MAG: alpha/beta hydrolase [Bacteroidales bacterium]|nr:alpha/beta hydrolase [Bacteroidales bacterium]
MKIAIGNIKLNYEKQGDGTPLVLLHGNGEDHHIFDKLIPLLQEDHTVYAIDSRNHGESSRTEDYAYETMAKDLEEFINVLGLKDVSVVGFSDGAIIALTLAIHKPGLFAKMGLLGVNLKPSDFKEEYLKELQDEYEETKDPLLKLMLEQPDIELEQLCKVTTPTLVVAAENDLFKPELYSSMVSTLPNAELLILPGYDHNSYVINQDVLYPHLKRFFQ